MAYIDVSQCQDPEQLFVTDEHGHRQHSAITIALCHALAVAGDYKITEENWLDVAARLTFINRLIPPFNAIAVIKSVTTINADGTESIAHEDIVLDWRTVRRYIGLRVNIPSVPTPFAKRMHLAVKNEIYAEYTAERKSQQ